MGAWIVRKRALAAACGAPASAAARGRETAVRGGRRASAGHTPWGYCLGFAIAFTFALVLGLLSTFCTPTAALAEEYSGEADWQVVFTGDKMESTFDTGKFDDVVEGLQPGDSAKFHVTLKNDADFDTNWYMKNTVLKSLEDTQDVASGGFYTYRLVYVDPSGTEDVLYDSDTVGGEKTLADREGLHEATDALKDFFFLGLLKPAEEAYVDLRIALDGETEGNAYQDTLAQVQMEFAVERAQADATPGSGDVTTSESTGDSASPQTPSIVQLVQTSDFWLRVAVFLVVFAVGVGVLVVALLRRSRERKDDR
ncbi:hypothetical protein GMI70_08110 [Eggerthellaceae bacterium zg-893]|nr:hypothetical protein [Eggerthellaceae bacterium zg-893]